MIYEEKLAAFNEHIEQGGKVETQDWMPDDYRRGVLKFIEMHANSEIMGALPERECLPFAPTPPTQDVPRRQDPGRGRSRAVALSSGRGPRQESRVHVRRSRWSAGRSSITSSITRCITGATSPSSDGSIDGAALVTQAALLDSSYAPYTRVLKRICTEEQLHLRHGEDITLELASGTDAQREMFQEALNRWWLADHPLLRTEVERR